MGNRARKSLRRDFSDEEPSKQPGSMSSWLSRTASSHQAQLAATAVVAGGVVAGAIFGYQALSRQARVEDLKRSIPDISKSHIAEELTDYGGASPGASSPLIGPSKEDERSVALAIRARQGDYDNDLILEQLARNRVFLTDTGLSKLRSAFVIVVGCGGVGSHATAALARSGVSKIRLIDFDQVTLSSLNRHAVATLADVGTPKVQCLRRRLEQVTPWTDYDCLNELFNQQAADRVLGPWEGRKPDYIIDAIDNIDSKVDLLSYCHRRSLPVISSMGAGCKSDPTRIFIGDISASVEDPLSRTTRRRLRALGVKDGIPVVYSTEKPGPGKAQLLPLPDAEFEKGKVGELGVLPDFRVRILPVLGTMPAIFGYTVANHVILSVSGYPHEYAPSKGRDKTYDSILATLQALIERLAIAEGEDSWGLKIPMSKDDVGYMVDEVFRGRSVVSGITTRLTLLPWKPISTGDTGAQARLVDHSTPGQKLARFQMQDLVCMTKEEAAVHEREVLKGGKRPEQMYGSLVTDLVEKRRKEAQGFELYR
ncbi:MAG: hypothetical protein M1837_007551 [Sclerophora amabilis]|nr:MAG: hypothetical protein M1837_007551 [Sclerophora amabilis]